jgi:hypothetical protein
MGTMTVETSQMRQTVEEFIKNVSRKWTNTGQLAVWPVGKLLFFCHVDGKAPNGTLENREGRWELE